MQIALAFAVFALVFASAPPEVESMRLEAGPELAGDAVVWAETDGARVRVRSGRANGSSRTLFDAAPPTDEHTWSVVALAASPLRIALLRRSTFCRRGDTTTVYPCVHSRQVLAAAPGQRLRTLVGTGACLLFSPFDEGSVDVVARTIFATESSCPAEKLPARVRLVRYTAAKRVIVRDRQMDPASCCVGMRATGRFAVWAGPSVVFLLDLRARRVVRTVEFGDHFVDAVTVQDDGKVAFVSRRIPGPPTALRVAWFDRSRSEVHMLPISARFSIDPDVELANDRIVVERKLEQGSELVVSDLRGRTRRLARFGGRFRLVGGFDFDGKLVTWASERVTSSRLDCPRPPSLRPCFWRDSGIRSLWLADIRRRTIAPELVAREQFNALIRVGG